MGLLNRKQIDTLKEIMLRDYGATLTDEDAQSLGVSLLRVSKLASVALARADEKNLVHSSERKTSSQSKDQRTGMCASSSPGRTYTGLVKIKQV
jgi:hypothetical protein